MIACELGQYCPAGSKYPLPCSVGHYCPHPSVQHSCDTALEADRIKEVMKQLNKAARASAIAFGKDPSDVRQFDAIVINGPGVYCPERSTEVRLCPTGFRCANSSTKEICMASEYCPEGTRHKRLCQAGYYCPNATVQLYCEKDEGSTLDIHCLPGQPCFSWRFSHEDLSKLPNYLVYDVGNKYCPEGSVSSELCPRGYYCLTPDVKAHCSLINVDRDRNHRSSEGIDRYFNSHYVNERDTHGRRNMAVTCHRRGSSMWHFCPTGFTCNNPIDNPIKCNDGAFCPMGSYWDTTCPKGYRCPNATTMLQVLYIYNLLAAQPTYSTHFCVLFSPFDSARKASSALPAPPRRIQRKRCARQEASVRRRLT